MTLISNLSKWKISMIERRIYENKRPFIGYKQFFVKSV